MRPTRRQEAQEQEARRLAALERYAVGTLPEAAFDRLTRLAARLCGAPIALISLVGASQIAFKSCFGLDLRQTDRSLGFCAYALHSPGVLVVPDTAQDERFAAHPLVVQAPHIRFYAGAPLITPGGHILGTLCILDVRPRGPLPPGELEALSDLAALVMDELELRLRTQEADREAQLRLAQAQELQGALKLSQLLRGIGDLADLDLAPEELLPHVVELTGAALDADWGGLAAIEGDQARSRSAWHTPVGAALAAQTGRTLRREDGGLLWRAAARDTPVFVADYAQEAGGRADLCAAGARAALSVSLGRSTPVQGGAVTHVMTLARLHDRPWTPRDHHLVEAVAGVTRRSLALASERAALRGSEARLHLALEAAPVLLWTTDMNGVFTVAQGRSLVDLGTGPQGVLGRPVREVYAGHPAILDNVDRALAGESFMTHIAVGERVYEARYAPLLGDGGQQVGTVGTGYDVTATVGAQREAVRAREQAEALLELSHLLGTEPAGSGPDAPDIQALAQTALAAVGRALGEGALVLWQRRGETFFPVVVQGEATPAVREHQAGGVPVSRYAAHGLLRGESAFLDPAGLPDDARQDGLRGAALLPVSLASPGREVLLGVYRTGTFQAWTPFERGLLAAAARTLAAGVERHRHLRRLETAARTDTLTGLGNRRAFELDLDAELSRARRQGSVFAVLSIDLDGLKAVNDTQGHARGDALLREFATCLRRCLRGEDRVHRLGGDEYVVLLPGVGPGETGVILERVRAAVDVTRAAGFGGVDASAGLACFPADADGAAELVRLSDLRMYGVKAARRGVQAATRSPSGA